MAGRRVTIEDVARRAGVHKATVSRALNPRTAGSVRPATITLVKQAAAELGYVPNPLARGLRTRSSMTVGVIVPDLTNPIFPPLVRGVESVLQPRGYTALLANTDGDTGKELAAFASLRGRHVDGFILATGTLAGQEFLAEAHEQGVPVVMANRTTAAASFPAVMADNAEGARLAVRHLLELGHRHLLVVEGPSRLSTARERAAAVAGAVLGREDVTLERVEVDWFSQEAGRAAMAERLRRGGPLPTGVVAANDLVALGAVRALRDHGLRCPEDVSVVGFNDMPFADELDPPLTTVAVPHHGIGAEAARVLLEGIDAGQVRARTVVLPTELRVRASTGPAPC